MVEIKSTSTLHKIGQERYKYLDLANLSYATATQLTDYRKVIGFLDAFEFTLEPGSEAKREVLQKKEVIGMERNDKIREWDNWKEQLGYFEREDIQVARDRIEVEHVAKRLDSCWEISKRYGLFND